MSSSLKPVGKKKTLDTGALKLQFVNKEQKPANGRQKVWSDGAYFQPHPASCTSAMIN